MEDVLEQLAALGHAGKAAVLATVVHVVGSAYRREAAKMLVDQDGRVYGTISGGCMEAEVAHAARDVLASGRPRLLHFDMTADDDLVWGLGLGCNGQIDVFLEPVDCCSPAEGCWGRVAAAREAGVRLAVATVVHAAAGPISAGARVYVYPDRLEGTLGDVGLDELVAADARRLLDRGASRSYLYRASAGYEGEPVVRERQAVLDLRGQAGWAQVYIETFAPPPVLLVFGAGHDAVPVTELAAAAGFRVVVVDSRPAYARPERFPRAHAVIHAHPEDVPERVPVDENTYVVVMTHNFQHDAEFLRQIWGRPCAYLGVLGPWQRTQRLLESLRASGCAVDAGLHRLYAPVGLDIGAEGPQQIALAVVAEALAVRNGAGGGFLRFRKGPLHRTNRFLDRARA